MSRRVIAIDQHRIGTGDFQRTRRHRRQHRVEIERGGNGAADFLEHLELVDRLRQVAGARLHLGFEARIGLVQLPRHAVELIGEFLQFVSGPHIDAVAEIAAAETPRAGAQRGDRDQHPPCEQRAGQDRDHEPEPDQKRDPHQLVADRRQRLLHRLLEQHGPAELRHRPDASAPIGRRYRRRRHGLAARVIKAATCGRPARFLPAPGPWPSLPAPDFGIDHIGESRLAELGLAEEIGEETKIDVGDGDAAIHARMRQRDRHERPRPLELGGCVADAPLGARVNLTSRRGPPCCRRESRCATAAAVRGRCRRAAQDASPAAPGSAAGHNRRGAAPASARWRASPS